MGRLGWTMEQQAGIRFYTRLTNIFTLLLIALFTALTLFSGRHRGWVVVAAIIVAWACFTLYMRRTKKGQP
ncbi:hypothetical protein ABT390_02355 [Streptomyces aurantiacus]|uniref:Uncharacterized protein n=1 Tax=Streptomyces aurantiacus JA 4570 TaxID=1286094 RepID=S4A5M2_9ACTN|nr:hypothetical protein [Streptomyces aurantiacus]EPH46035.1 hypothetical protein STRAU_0916 [Streptomyces aurantiacus JA 4570]